MTIDLDGARSFLATHGRLLDRRRLRFLLGEDDAGGVLAALDGYRNADGGYGWSLEPDLRSAISQPTAAMHAFEVLTEVAPAISPRAVEICDWLTKHCTADGGLPFVVPFDDTAGCAPWWIPGDTTTSSLQMTAQVAAQAHLVARHDPAVAGHPWLAVATEWCLATIGAMDGAPSAHEFLFALRFLDAASPAVPEADAVIDHLGRFLPTGGTVPVAGGAEGEMLRPLDFTPDPLAPSRRLFASEDIARDLDRLAALQQPDGGWVVDFRSASSAATLEWRGYATVEAVKVLRANGAA